MLLNRKTYIQKMMNQPGLVGCWIADKQGGGTLMDLSGKNNHGKLYGPSWISEKGIWRLSFDGTDDYVDCEDTNLPSGAAARTVEFWTKRASSGNFTNYPYPFFYGTKTGYNGFGLYGFTNTTDMWFYGHGYDFDTGIDLNDTLWHHIVLTFDGTNLRAYKDSVLISTTNRGSLNTVLGPDNFVIGGFKVTNQYWDGLIDEVRIYNRALSSIEIKLNYEIGKEFH